MDIKDLKLSTRQMLIDISSMVSQAQKLLKYDRPYNKLLETIIKLNLYYDEEATYPAVKELSSMTGIKYSLLRKYLRQIYIDMLFGDEKVDTPSFSFHDITYLFFVRGHDKDEGVCFEVDKLPIVPRVGEELELPFFKAYLRVCWFYVEEVRHVFNDYEQEIHISIRPGKYNLYWKYRKDKAEEEGELSMRDFWDLNDWELKRKLKVGRHF